MQCTNVFLFSTYPPFKLNAFVTTGPGSFMVNFVSDTRKHNGEYAGLCKNKLIDNSHKLLTDLFQVDCKNLLSTGLLQFVKSQKLTSLLRLVDKLQQVGKIHNLQQVCRIFGCVVLGKMHCLLFSLSFDRQLYKQQLRRHDKISKYCKTGFGSRC